MASLDSYEVLRRDSHQLSTHDTPQADDTGQVTESSSTPAAKTNKPFGRLVSLLRTDRKPDIHTAVQGPEQTTSSSSQPSDHVEVIDLTLDIEDDDSLTASFNENRDTTPQEIEAKPEQHQTSNQDNNDVDDDDLIIVDPEEASKMDIFKGKQFQYEHPGFNTPAPVPHFGETSTRLQVVRSQLHDKQQLLNSLKNNEVVLLKNLQSAIILLQNLNQRYHDSVASQSNEPSSVNVSNDLAKDVADMKQEIVSLQSRLGQCKRNIFDAGRQIAQLELTKKNLKDKINVMGEMNLKRLLERSAQEEEANKRRHEELRLQYQQQNAMLQRPPQQLPQHQVYPPTAFQPLHGQFDALRPEWSFEPSTTLFNHQSPFVNVNGAQNVGYSTDMQPTFPQTYTNVQDEDHIKDLLNNIVPDEEEVEEEGLPTTPPELRISLYKHQRVGLDWLLRMEDSKSKGGILADDMGLGKTIQAIALMMAHKSDDENRKTTLIIAPVSLMRQWKTEIEKHTKVPIRVALYHGPDRRKQFRSFKDFQRYDVILSPYSTVTSEFKKHYEVLFKKNDTNMTTQNVIPDLGTGGEKYSSPFFQNDSHFYRIILDEAQAIKNKLSLASKSVTVLSARYRFCLTGTPMQNSIDELFPLIRFLRIKPYSDEASFRAKISVPLRSDSHSDSEISTKRIRVLLRAILLRRSKTSKIDGEPILQLPEKHVKDIYVDMDAEELDLYKAIENRLQHKAKKLFMANHNFSNILVLLLRLRQACCHTYLCELGSAHREGEFRGKNWRALFQAIQKLGKPERRFLLEELRYCASEENLIELKDLDSESEAPEDVKSRPPINRIKDDEDDDYLDDDDIELISIKDFSEPAGITDEVKPEQTPAEEKTEGELQIKQNDTKDVAKKENVLEVKNGESADAGGVEEGIFTCPVCFMSYTTQSAFGFKCHHKVCEDCIGAYVEEHKSEDEKSVKCAECDVVTPISGLIDYKMLHMALFEKKSKSDIERHIRETYSGNVSIAEKVRRLLVKHGEFSYSTKMMEALNIVQNTFEKYPGEKIIIFSQFTMYFELLKIMFNKEKIPILRYDGTMSIDQKDLAIKEFERSSSYNVMLISLKAGNVGLTLNCASHVIIMDPFWNPYVEDQAMDRAHRIGQRREVFVYRILINQTVEERIVDLQQKKKDLINSAMDENSMKSVSKLSRQDLQYLFGLGR